MAFEKQFGDREGIEDAIFGKRRLECEEEIRKNPMNYDSWFDYIQLEEALGLETKRGLERFMKERLLMFLRPRRSGIGSVICICGSTMLHMKSLMRRTWIMLDSFMASV